VAGCRAWALRPGMRRYLRIDGKALRGAAPRGGRAPMLPSEIWDDGTTAAQLPVNVKKTNEIPVFRDLLKKVPDLAGAVISADEMHTQRRHARDIHAAGAFYIFTLNRWEPLAPMSRSPFAKALPKTGALKVARLGVTLTSVQRQGLTNALTWLIYA
jgi:hypothetical protein